MDPQWGLLSVWEVCGGWKAAKHMRLTEGEEGRGPHLSPQSVPERASAVSAATAAPPGTCTHLHMLPPGTGGKRHRVRWLCRKAVLFPSGTDWGLRGFPPTPRVENGCPNPFKSLHLTPPPHFLLSYSSVSSLVGQLCWAVRLPKCSC